jgi:hypothetical protein
MSSLRQLERMCWRVLRGNKDIVGLLLEGTGF